MRILLLDNYDSFTYNLVHYLESFDCEIDVIRNDEISLGVIDKYDKIVLSPGHGLPSESGKLMEVISAACERKAILGVCLGFQGIIEHFGGQIYNQNEVKHGVSEKCSFENSSKLFKDLPNSFYIGLYHSWAAEKASIPHDLKVTATSENNVVMAFEHQTLPICGVQFHPESIMTEHGRAIVNNFLSNF